MKATVVWLGEIEHRHFIYDKDVAGIFRLRPVFSRALIGAINIESSGNRILKVCFW
jgi:hypothetical protein